MSAPRIRGALLLVLIAGACKSGTEPKLPPAASIKVVSGTQAFGIKAAMPFAVQVLDNGGAPVAGATVEFQVTSGPGTPSPTSATTDAQGMAQTSVTLGTGSGLLQVTATVKGTTVAITGSPMLSLNTNADSPCDGARIHGARVVAASQKAIVVADTGNPAGGFSGSQYLGFGITFDTLVDAVDRNAFGDPTDIDDNGRILILFTYSVNQLTPANSNGVVGGFFYERDLFPTTGDPQFSCKGSNMGEMFYMLVPDPNGTINGNKRDTAFVRALTTGTIAHEYQHLINAGRRLYVNNADAFEEVWLNEGLSHIAEELTYFKASGHAPRENIDAAVIRASPASVDVFNEFQNNNFGRFREFLLKSSNSSPYADNDSLETRGATWNLLRYLADHRGTDDGDTWRQLDNSTTTGLANMTNVFGANLMDQIRNWATSVETDDFGGVTDATFLQPSWNLRSVYVDGYQKGSGLYPLAFISLVNGVPSTVNLVAGGEAYFRFGVAAASQASVDWMPTGSGPLSTSACQSSGVTTPLVGQVITPVSGTGMCLGGGTIGAEYTLIPFFSSSTQSATTSIDVVTNGSVPVTTPERVPTSGPVFDRFLAMAPRLSATPTTGDFGASFDAHLRRRARSELTRLIPGARAWARSNPNFRMPADRNLVPTSGSRGIAVNSLVQFTLVRTK